MKFMKHLLWSLVVTFAVAGAGCGDDSDTSSADAAPQQPADAAPTGEADAAPAGEIDAAPGGEIDAGDETADAG